LNLNLVKAVRVAVDGGNGAHHSGCYSVANCHYRADDDDDDYYYYYLFIFIPSVGIFPWGLRKK